MKRATHSFSGPLVWLSPWTRRCGVADYSKALWPAFQAEAKARGVRLEILSLDEFSTGEAIAERLAQLKPSLLHVQHEYGLFGGKVPPRYRFPRWVRRWRGRFPELKIVATAHAVLPPDYAYPVRGRGWQAPLRAAANAGFLPRLKKFWGPRTWGPLDAVIVHSRIQQPWVLSSGCPRVEVIPHFVAELPPQPVPRREPNQPPTVMVFGFLTPEKGQDLALEALIGMRKEFSNVKLLFAGGVRRPEDEPYADRLRERIHDLELGPRVKITGFVPDAELNALYAKADLVLVPFRETAGSGSLAQALARGAAILASDLPLNRDLAERQPGVMEFFRAQDTDDCSHQIAELLAHPERLRELSQAARGYAAQHSPVRIARQHFELYDSLGS